MARDRRLGLALLALVSMAAAAGTEQLWVRKPRSRSAFVIDSSSLGALCTRHGLRLSEMEQVAAGKRRNCKGWECGPVEEEAAEEEDEEEEERINLDADQAAAADIFGAEATVIGNDGVPRTNGDRAATAADAPPPTVASVDEDEDEDDDDESVVLAAGDDDDDDDAAAASRASAVSTDAAAAASGGFVGRLVGLLRTGPALSVLVSPAVTLALALTPKKITADLQLARTLFYIYALVFFGATFLAQISIAALPDDADDEATCVRVQVAPSAGAAMQAALAGSGAPPPEPEEQLLSRREYDASELGKMRSAVISGGVLNVGLSFVMKQKGASLLLHRSIVGLCDLVLHPLFRAHVLTQTGLFGGKSKLTRVTRPFPPPMTVMELLMKANGGSNPLAPQPVPVGDDDEDGSAVPAVA